MIDEEKIKKYENYKSFGKLLAGIGFIGILSLLWNKFIFTIFCISAIFLIMGLIIFYTNKKNLLNVEKEIKEDVEDFLANKENIEK